jgi:hypothetical protein
MKTPTSQARFKVMIGQLTGILISRRRQRDVFGPSAIMLLMGIILFIDAVAGPKMDSTLNILLALTLSGWAGYRSWQIYRAEPSQFHLLLGAGTLLLILGAVALLLGVHLQALWAGLLVLVALAFLFGR